LPPRQTATEKQATGVYDLSVLPVFTGSVVQFLPAPHGGIVGFVLDDGTQVFVSPEQAHTFAGLIKVGDKVDIRGIKGQVLPIIVPLAWQARVGARYRTALLKCRYTPLK
jgi:hypothetical protein